MQSSLARGQPHPGCFARLPTVVASNVKLHGSSVCALAASCPCPQYTASSPQYTPSSPQYPCPQYPCPQYPCPQYAYTEPIGTKDTKNTKDTTTRQCY